MAAEHILDNPVWASLCSGHAPFAIGGSRAKRYPADFGPFAAVPDSSEPAPAELISLLDLGESVYLAGQAPPIPEGLELLEESSMLQMVCERPAAPVASHDFSVLTERDAPHMLTLTGLAFPGFFRTRTCEMGNYLGIRIAGALVAMAGERMLCGGYREISAVCTHPDFVGRGYARRLVAHLVNANFECGLIPFLHVSHSNARARRLYEDLGFTSRASLRLVSIRRSLP